MTAGFVPPVLSSAAGNLLPAAPPITGPQSGATLIVDPGGLGEKGLVTLVEGSGTVSRYSLGGEFRDQVDTVVQVVAARRVARVLVDGEGSGWAIFEALQSKFYARRDVVVRLLTTQPVSMAVGQ